MRNEKNEVMMNEEVVEAAEEIATIAPKIDLAKAAGVALIVVGGIAVGRAVVRGAKKYIIDPIKAKSQAKKDARVIEAEFENTNVEELDSNENA